MSGALLPLRNGTLEGDLELAGFGFLQAGVPVSFGGGAWGSISGTLSDQTDLQTALTGKVPTTRTVNGHALSADVTVTKTDVGLGSVDNTSDVGKPVSTVQATAIALKLAIASNLSDLANVATARTNLGLGTLATQSGTFSGTSSGTNTGDQVVPANTTGTSHQFFSAYNSTTGAFTKTQPAIADLSDAGTLATWAAVTSGTGVATALAVNIGSAGAFVTFNGALGTPSSGNGSNLTALNATQLTSGTVPLARLSGITTTQTTGIAASGANTDLTSLALTAASTLTLAPAANTAATGWLLTDTTAASSGNQQYSPAVRWTGQGWKTTATAGSQAVDFRAYVVPVQGAANPTGNWTLESSINGGSFANPIVVNSAGQMQAQPGSSSAPGYAFVGDTNSGLFSRSAGAVLGISIGGFQYYDINTVIIKARKEGGFGWSGTSFDPTGNADTALFRNAAGVVEITNNTAGQWGGLKLGTRDAATNTVTDGLTLGHQTTGTQTSNAAGLGESILFNINSTTTADRNAGRLLTKWTTATDASRTSAMVLQTVNNAGALADALTVNGDGSANLAAAGTSAGSIATIDGTQTLTNKTITQSAWTNATLQNSWANAAGTAAYMKDSMGFVHLKGLISGGTTTAATVLFTLPAGFRPLEGQYFKGVNSNQINVDTSGNVNIDTTASGSISFSGITFSTF